MTRSTRLRSRAALLGDLSLSDNSAGRDVPVVDKQSSLLVLRLSGSGPGRKATAVRRYRPPKGVLSRSRGNADRLKDGNSLVGWGSVPRITEFAPDGTIAFDANFNSSAAGCQRSYSSACQGLETRISLPAVGSRVKVAALDAEAGNSGAPGWLNSGRSPADRPTRLWRGARSAGNLRTTYRNL